MMSLLAGVAGAGACVGVVQALAASWLVTAFVGRTRVAAAVRPAVTVLKPLHGDEPLLEDALATLCRQDYPAWQIVFGVQDTQLIRPLTRWRGCARGFRLAISRWWLMRRSMGLIARLAT